MYLLCERPPFLTACSLHAFVHNAKIQSVHPLAKEAFLGIFNVMWWCKDDYNIKKGFKAYIYFIVIDFKTRAVEFNIDYQT